jgi:hypothetical protein
VFGGLASFLRGRSRPAASPGAERVCVVADIEEKYDVCDTPVIAPAQAITQEEYRHYIAAGLLAPTHEHGPTKVGLRIGCNEQTVRDARDERSTLRGDFAWNLLLVDPHALGPIAAHFGKVLVDRDRRPVDWNEVAVTAAELVAEVSRARAKGHISHLDLPKLRTLVRRAMAAMQGAA